MNTITGLRDFYVLDGKLLYTSKDFIGYDPFISKGLSHAKVKSGVIVKVDEFELNNSSFVAILTYFIAGGPLRGYKRVEIIKNGSTIIRYEIGGKGHGTNYSEGERYFISYSDAFMVYDGYSMKADKVFTDYSGDDYYLFWFKNIVIPTKYECNRNKNNLRDKKTYTANEIEPLRQVEWDTNVIINNREYHIVKTSIPGYFQTKWDEEGGTFCRVGRWSALSKTDIQLIGDKC